MKVNRKIEIEEVTGTWIVSEGEHSQAYAHTGIKEYIRFMKDLLIKFDLQNLLEVKERV